MRTMHSRTNPPDPTKPRAVWPPEPGAFKLRLVPRGWQVPARIVRESSPGVVTGAGEPVLLWHAVIDGIARHPNIDPANAEDVARIWHGGERIDETEYRWLVATGDWARAHDPRHPAANPLYPIDPSRLRPLKPRTPHS
jgi:hypothetical protein